MKFSRIILLSGILLFGQTSGAISQQVISNFSLTNVKNNQTVSLEDYNQKGWIVVIFTSNYCPYSKLYEDRIIKLAEKFNDEVAFLLINPNDPEESKKDAVSAMAERAKSKRYPFPYLADKNQKVANQFNALKTPEAFLLKSRGNKFEIIYRGAIDDNPQVPADVGEHYLRNAIEASIEGRSIHPTQTRPTGCMIKD